jgi:hypothetical protein
MGVRAGLSVACRGATMPSASNFENGQSKGGRPWRHRPRGRGGNVSVAWLHLGGGGRAECSGSWAWRSPRRLFPRACDCAARSAGPPLRIPSVSTAVLAFFDSKQRRIKGEGDDMAGPTCKQLRVVASISGLLWCASRAGPRR